MAMERSVCVHVGGKKAMLDRVNWSTTAKDIINRLTTQRASTSYVLLESWNGCSRVIGHNEKILKVLDQWGFGCEGEHAHTMELAKSKLYRQKSSHYCRVAKRKCTSKTARVKKINSILKQLNRKREEYKILTTPTKPPQQQLSLSMDASSLPPELEEEFVALQEALAEEERENSDLVRRREELSGNIQSQKREMETLEESLSMLEVKVKNEEHKLARLIETTGPPELEDAQKEVAKLQNELIVRTKLNKLQTSKLQELGNIVSRVEQEFQDTAKQIERLKLEQS